MWDKRYAVEDYVYGTEPNDFLREHTGQLAVGRTLCIGEGEGRNAVFLAGLGHRVTAVDASAVGLQKAQRLARQKGVTIETVHADLGDYSLQTEYWDNIIAIFCHLPSELRHQVHGQVGVALRPGGHFLLEAYTLLQLEYGTGGPSDPSMMMSLSSLRQELTGLDIRHGKELVRDIHEGQFHTGSGAVVQIMATRP